MKRRAFTLIELLVVIAIIAMLAAMLMPVLSRGKERGRTAVCLSNLHQMGIALQVYIGENNNHLPFMNDMPTNSLITNLYPPVNIVLKNQLGSTNVLRCPSDNEGLFETTGSSYSWNNLLNGVDAANPNAINTLGVPITVDQIPVFSDKDKFHLALGPQNAKNFLYADQHCQNFYEGP